MQNWFLSVFIAAQRKREKGGKGEESASTYQGKQRLQLAPIREDSDSWQYPHRHLAKPKSSYSDNRKSVHGSL